MCQYTRYKDKLFRFIFNHNKEWLLSLYNALNGTHYTDPVELTITTLEDVIYIKMKNDISLLLDSEMNLYKHQSSWNPNMPLRGLFYFSTLYKAYLSAQEKDLYGKTLVKIPAPRYVVFYNGDRKTGDVVKLRLSDAFEKDDESGEFQWTATLYNINQDHNKALQDSCVALKHYSIYVDKVKRKLAAGLSLEQAAPEAVKEAIEENLLDGFFKKHEKGVLDMTLTEFNEEEFIRNRKEEGREEGKYEATINMARYLCKENVSEDLTISALQKELSLSHEEAKELFEKEVACFV